MGILNKYIFEDEEFKDASLKDKVISYYDYVRQSKDSFDIRNKDDLEFYIKWNEIYIDRSKLILDLYNNYGLKVDEKYIHNFDELPESIKDTEKELEKCNALHKIVYDVNFEVVSDEYGVVEYEAIFDNTTGYDISSLTLKVTLLDNDGVVLDSYYPGIEEVAAGEKGKLDFSANDNASDMKIQVYYYSFD